MREILFRGKRANGDWYYGSYLYLNVPARDWKGDVRGKPEPVHYIVDEKDVNYAVDPATVGQYTGLTDKNGKKIFEGDVVRYAERQFGGEDAPVIHAVEYSEGGFAVYNYFLNNWLRDVVDGNTELHGIEVTGNIYDNPELLEA